MECMGFTNMDWYGTGEEYDPSTTYVMDPLEITADTTADTSVPGLRKAAPWLLLLVLAGTAYVSTR